MLKHLLFAAAGVLFVLVVVYCVHLAVLLYPILTADAPEMAMGTLGQDEVELFEKTLGLSIPDGTERIWVVLDVGNHSTFVNVRLDVPAEQLGEVKSSQVLRGGEVWDGTLPLGLPEILEAQWWQIDMPPDEDEQRLYLRLPKSNSACIATRDDMSSVYLQYAVDTDTVPEELAEFMEAHPIEIRSLFPLRSRMFGGCWERPSE